MTRPFRTFLALALIAHLLVIVAMAVSPHLHEAIHHDADDDDHECAVTLFICGATDDAPPPVPTAVDFACVGVMRMEVAQAVFCARVEGRIRERAPPVGAV